MWFYNQLVASISADFVKHNFKDILILNSMPTILLIQYVIRYSTSNLNQWTFKFIDQVKKKFGTCIPLTLMKQQHVVKHGYKQSAGDTG